MKIKDRLLLGLVVGLGANIPKQLIGHAGMKYKLAEVHGPQIAAGVFIPGHKINTTPGKIVSYVADAAIAGILGTVTVYALSITGKDNYLVKGAAVGQIMWEGVYGLFTALGATKVKSTRPFTILNEFISHTAFGIAAAAIAANLGHESLFDGTMKMSATTPPQNHSMATTDLPEIASSQIHVKVNKPEKASYIHQ